MVIWASVFTSGGGGGSFIATVFWVTFVAATHSFPDDGVVEDPDEDRHCSSFTTPSIASFCETEGVYIEYRWLVYIISHPGSCPNSDNTQPLDYPVVSLNARY